jgi:hypothetical protein
MSRRRKVEDHEARFREPGLSLPGDIPVEVEMVVEV